MTAKPDHHEISVCLEEQVQKKPPCIEKSCHPDANMYNLQLLGHNEFKKELYYSMLHCLMCSVDVQCCTPLWK